MKLSPQWSSRQTTPSARQMSVEDRHLLLLTPKWTFLNIPLFVSVDFNNSCRRPHRPRLRRWLIGVLRLDSQKSKKAKRHNVRVLICFSVAREEWSSIAKKKKKQNDTKWVLLGRRRKSKKAKRHNVSVDLLICFSVRRIQNSKKAKRHKMCVFAWSVGGDEKAKKQNDTTYVSFTSQVKSSKSYAYLIILSSYLLQCSCF
jgi:hypothetical protein